MLADAGLENALRIKDGKITQVETDPCKPSFLAEVDPTPTFLIIETNAKNDAVGVTAMSLGADNKGGWVLQVPLETRRRTGKLLWQVWREAALPVTPVTTTGSATTTRPATSTTTTRPAATQATTTVGALTPDSMAAGKAAMAQAVGKLLGFSFPTDVIVLPTKTLASLMTPAMPISFTL